MFKTVYYRYRSRKLLNDSYQLLEVSFAELIGDLVYHHIEEELACCRHWRPVYLSIFNRSNPKSGWQYCLQDTALKPDRVFLFCANLLALRISLKYLVHQALLSFMLQTLTKTATKKLVSLPRLWQIIRVSLICQAPELVWGPCHADLALDDCVQEGAKLQLAKGQPACGLELAVLLIEVPRL